MNTRPLSERIGVRVPPALMAELRRYMGARQITLTRAVVTLVWLGLRGLGLAKEIDAP